MCTRCEDIALLFTVGISVMYVYTYMRECENKAPIICAAAVVSETTAVDMPTIGFLPCFLY